MLGTGEIPQIVEVLSHTPTSLAGAAPHSPRPRRRWRFIATGIGRSGRGQAADLPLRRQHAAASGDATALRVCEGGGRLRLHLRLLHHSAAARPLSLARRPTRSCAKHTRSPIAGSKSCCSSVRTPPSTATICGERGALGRLLRQLNRVDGLEWIRLLYLYPTTIDDAMLDAMAESEKVCKYIDLPLQHASDAVLETHAPSRDARQLRAPARSHPDSDSRRRPPDDLHRGLPRRDRGRLRRALGIRFGRVFDHIGVFTYSHEEGTRAGEWDDDVPAATKRKRRDRLMARQQRDRRAPRSSAGSARVSG